GRRLGILWTRYPRPVSARRRVRRSHPQRREPGVAGHRDAGQRARSGRRGDRVKRRAFITLLGGAAAAWSLAAEAQPGSPPVIGYLSGRWADAEIPYVTGFRQALEELGYVDGNNVAIEFRFSGGQDNRLAPLAADLLRRESDPQL